MASFCNRLISEIGHRVIVHWKTSLIGAVEGSGLSLAGVLSGDPKMLTAAVATGGYLFVKGLLVKDGK